MIDDMLDVKEVWEFDSGYLIHPKLNFSELEDLSRINSPFLFNNLR